MALYHLTAKVHSRAKGQSACGAAAYRAGVKIENEYDGVVYDYTRKQNVEYSTILLPDNAPREYHNRSKLWNSVEMNEKQCNARLCREIEFALPRELPQETREQMALEFIKENFVDEGMCADVNFHNPPKMNSKKQPINALGEITNNEEEYIYLNPHVHCLLTMRPIDEDGKWKNKLQKKYICEKEGIQRAFTGEELKKVNGWEKLYYYKDDNNKKVWHTKSYVNAHPEEHLEQINRYPKSIQEIDPVVAKWDDSETLLKWREAWAQKVNYYYEMYQMDIRVSHLSYENQGIELIPTIHEGKEITIEEKRLKEQYEEIKSIETDAVSKHTYIREMNNEIREHNRNVMMKFELDELKNKMHELMKPVLERIDAIKMSLAEQIENLRCDIIQLRIKIKHIVSIKGECDIKLREAELYLKDLNKVRDEKDIDIKIEELKLKGQNIVGTSRLKKELETKIKLLEQKRQLIIENRELAQAVMTDVHNLKEESQALDVNLTDFKVKKEQKMAEYSNLMEEIPIDDPTFEAERLKIRATLEGALSNEYRIESEKFEGKSKKMEFEGVKF